MKIFKIFPIIILVLGLAACGGSGGDGSGDIDSGDDGEFIVSGSATVGDISISFPKAVIASTLEGNFFAVPAEDDALAALVKATGDDADLALCVAEDAVDAELVHDDNADGTTMSAGLDLRDVDPMSALILCILPDSVEFASGGKVGGRAMRIEAEEALLQFGVWKLYPAFGAKDVPPEENVLAFFNSAAKADDVTAENFYLTKIEGGSLTTPEAAVSLSESGRIATLDPKSVLDEDQKYYARLRGIIRDEAGAGRIGATIIWSFTTGEASAVAWPPCDESNCLQFMTEALGDGKCNMFEGDPGKAPGGGVGYDYPAEMFLLLLKDAKEQEKLAALACMVNYATSEAHRSAIMGGCLPLDLAFELMAAGECGIGEKSPEDLLYGDSCSPPAEGVKPGPDNTFNYEQLIQLFINMGLDQGAAESLIECILNAEGIQDYIVDGCLPANEEVGAARDACFAGGGDECSMDDITFTPASLVYDCTAGEGCTLRDNGGMFDIQNACGETVSFQIACVDYEGDVDICGFLPDLPTQFDLGSGTMSNPFTASAAAFGAGTYEYMGGITVTAVGLGAVAIPVAFHVAEAPALWPPCNEAGTGGLPTCVDYLSGACNPMPGGGDPMDYYLGGYSFSSAHLAGLLTPAQIACIVAAPNEEEGQFYRDMITAEGNHCLPLDIYIVMASLPEDPCGLQEEENNPPVADDQSVSVDAGINPVITLSATDGDGDSLTYRIEGAPWVGTLYGWTGSGYMQLSDGVELTDPSVTYFTPVGYSGGASFTFSASDGKAQSNTATVSITISAAGGYNIVAYTSPSTDPVSVDFTCYDITQECSGGEFYVMHSDGSDPGGYSLSCVSDNPLDPCACIGYTISDGSADVIQLSCDFASSPGAGTYLLQISVVDADADNAWVPVLVNFNIYP